jgi:hypothetical protein
MVHVHDLEDAGVGVRFLVRVRGRREYRYGGGQYETRQRSSSRTTPSLDDPADPYASVIAIIYQSVRRIGFVLPGWRGRESGDAYSMADFDVAR